MSVAERFLPSCLEVCHVTEPSELRQALVIVEAAERSTSGEVEAGSLIEWLRVGEQATLTGNNAQGPEGDRFRMQDMYTAVRHHGLTAKMRPDEK